MYTVNGPLQGWAKRGNNSRDPRPLGAPNDPNVYALICGDLINFSSI